MLSQPDGPVVRGRGVGHWFVAGRVLFRQLDFTWRPGGVVGVVGPSGSGKSTLLSLLAGWEAPRQGVIEQSNVRSVRWVFQNPHGVPRRSALDHVALPLVALGASRRQAEREAAELLRRVGLAEVAAQSFAALSGGEAQRLMLARGLAGRPDLLLIDEPTAQLDRAAAREVDRALARLALDGVIVVVATHDPETRAICSQVLDLGQTPAPAADPIRPAPAPAAATWGGPPDRSQRPAEDPDQGHRDDGPEADHGPARGEEPSHRPERERRGRLPPGAGRPAANQRVRWAEVAREAWRNTVGGASKAAVWALLAALAWAACAWLDTRQTADLVTASADYLAGGGATWVLEAPGAVSGTACDGLASAAGVQAAGAWREEPDDLTLAVWPSAPLPLVSVTPGFLKLLGAAPAAGLALPDTLMTRLGLTPPATIASRDGPVTIGAAYAYPEDGRRTGLGYAAVSPTLADQPFDQCWLTVWPTDQSNRLLAWAALAPQGEAGTNQQPPKLSQLNPSLAADFDGARDFARRPTRHLPLVAAAAGLLLAGGAVVSRRLEIAAELHTGLPKAAVLGHLALEAAAWITLALALAAPTVWAAAADLSWDLPGVLRLGLRPLAAGAGGAALGTIAAAAAIQEKQLFTLFKNR